MNKDETTKNNQNKTSKHNFKQKKFDHKDLLPVFKWLDIREKIIHLFRCFLL